MKYLCNGEELQAVFKEMGSHGALIGDYMPTCNNLSSKGRTCYLVSGENIGGYIGLSYGEDGFHLGTPEFAQSKSLIAACEKIGLKQVGG